MKIGVLALQGAVAEHLQMLLECGVEPVEVRLPKQLEGCSGLIIPGGESTTISKLMREYGLDKEILKKYRKGMAIFGTCAGAILLAKKIIGEKRVKSLGLIDISVQRNAYGRQVDSFEAELNIKKAGKYNGIFIRAPAIESVQNGVEVLAELNKKAVLVRKDNILVATFHPELTQDKRVHELFVSLCK